MRFVCRFAPSPNGRLHLGHAFSAMVNSDAARRMDGRFLLRMEDIDTARCRPEYEAGILEDLAWLSIVPSGPPRRQSEHFAEYAAALARLETLLALVEGWVDAVVTAAAQDRLPGADALREAVRRRRASGGPAEKVFANLVGLELRPRRLRDAATLWEELHARRGAAGRDAVWAHPDLLPTADDLDDVAGFAARSAPLDLSELEGLPPAPEERPDGDAQ